MLGDCRRLHHPCRLLRVDVPAASVPEPHCAAPDVFLRPPQIPSSATLLTPSACRSLWRQLKAETEYTISSAIAAQEAHKRNNSWLPPPWAIVAMIVLGFNEFMALVRSAPGRSFSRRTLQPNLVLGILALV